MFEDLDLNAIHEENARELIERLLNMVEQLSGDLRDARAETQRYRDEINRLKGEQGKPKIKGNKPKPPTSDHSSEQERHKRKRHMKSSKKAEIHIDREEVLDVDRAELPADAEPKGSEDVVVQDLIIHTDNVCFHKQKYYSASAKKTYLAELPKGYAGQYGPGIKTLIVTMYFGMGTSEPKIREFFENMGVQISEGEVSNLLIKDQDGFHAESDAVYAAGLRSCPHQQTDDTLTRLNGQNQHCHVVCNPAYTSYHTRPRKDRLTVLDVLRQGRKRVFRLNGEALRYLEKVALSKAAQEILPIWCSEEDLDEVAFLGRLDSALPALNTQQRKAIIDAAAVAAYHAEKDFPVVDTLVCDDAPQFTWLTRNLMLCWVHAGRAYKKLVPVIPLHRQQLDTFLKRFWEYYDQLLNYCQDPTPEECARLEAGFDELFATKTGYEDLDQRIAKTRDKKTPLLLVLQYPELPLHNNASELAVRQRVRKRDVSFGPRTQEGLHAWDTFMTLAATAKKLGISFYAYIHDRISGTNQILPMATLVEQRARELNLGRCWVTT
jgi:hypothetical protein